MINTLAFFLFCKIVFCYFELSAFSPDIPEIVSQHQLETGDYLLPASEKVAIGNCLNPSQADLQNIQRYLSSTRPELKYLNFPGTTWRENRIRQFKITSKEIPPEFGIIYFNNSPEDKRNCITTYISCDSAYLKKLHALIIALRSTGFSGHFIYRIGGWPATDQGSLECVDVPYSFKIFSILEAKQLGYQNCLWLDACMVPKKCIDPVFDSIEKTGIFYYSLINYSHQNHVQEFALQAMGSSLEEFLNIPPLTTIVIGLDLSNTTSLQLLEDWRRIAEEKLGFLSFIPEMAPFNLLVHRYHLDECGTALYHPYKKTLGADGILFWDHD